MKIKQNLCNLTFNLKKNKNKNKGKPLNKLEKKDYYLSKKLCNSNNQIVYS